MLSRLLPYSWAILKSEFTSSCLTPGTLNDEFYIVFFVCWAHFTYTLEQCWSQNSHLVASCPEPSTTSSILYFSYVDHTSPILLRNSGRQHSHLVALCLEPSTMSSILYFSYVEHTSPILWGNSGHQNSHLVASCPEPLAGLQKPIKTMQRMIFYNLWRISCFSFSDRNGHPSIPLLWIPLLCTCN